MLTYINTCDESQCCGCGACVEACSKKALCMKPNSEGFHYPVLNAVLCVNCGLCDMVCPMNEEIIKTVPQEIYAFQHNDVRLLSNSSSGGAFRLLADKVIKNNGYVVGCILNEQNQAEMAVTADLNVLAKMQGSKYVSSSMNGIYNDVKLKLSEGKLVLFTGSPCQCVAIQSYLGKTYDNLITVDFLCHGMPSQYMLDEYINTVETKLGTKIHDIKFRDKSQRGWGMCFSYRHGKKIKKEYGRVNEYIRAFQSNIINRYSCYYCPFCGKERFTDFTFCDYWGVYAVHKEVDSTKGVSALSVNTEKATLFIEDLKNSHLCIKTDFESVAKENPEILYKRKHCLPLYREDVYKSLKESGWNAMIKRFFPCKNLILKKMWYSVPNDVQKIVRNVRYTLRCLLSK